MTPPKPLSLTALEATHDPWPEPVPLVPHGTAEPYPANALPSSLREAVSEVHEFTQAPVALVAGSALAALSVSAAHQADVERAQGLAGPSSVFLLTVADSGERKTTCDRLFLDGLREWECRQAEKVQPALTGWRGQFAAWEAAHDGMKNRIRAAARSQKDYGADAATLADHEATKPERPRIPRLIRTDDTPEALAWSLAHEWPAAGVISSEAGLVFGSHGMGRDTVMRNLGLFNVLWDGGALPVSRRTSESFTVRGARLTMALQVQEPTLRVFFTQADGLARGTGFLSRFLIAWPESTQGTRIYRAPPPDWPALEAYRGRLVQLLEMQPPLAADQTLAPPLLRLTPEAAQAWRCFHDSVERELREGGELADVRDVAAKAADNVARLAGLFHVLAHGCTGSIGLEHVEAAGRLVAWHLTEARRFFGALALPPELVNAEKLEAWMIPHCREKRSIAIQAGDVLRLGPSCVRRAGNRDAALEVLTDAGHVRVDTIGKQKRIRLNPALLA